MSDATFSFGSPDRAAPALVESKEGSPACDGSAEEVVSHKDADEGSVVIVEETIQLVTPTRSTPDSESQANFGKSASSKGSMPDIAGIPPLPLQ